jgi:hypothetical protein
MPARDLRRLERIRNTFDESAAQAKLALLRRLATSRLATAGQVERLHETLCFLRAYPDDARVLAQVTRMLDRFDRRADLVRHRERLADTGIAGTSIHYRFFWSTARWLATRWPGQLELERDDDEANAQLDKVLPLVAPAVAAEWFNAGTLPALPAIDVLRGRSSDADWLVGQLARMPGDGFTREAFADGIDAPFVLRPGRDTPSRTTAFFAAAPRAFQVTPLRRTRPDLRAAVTVPPRGVRPLSRPQGAALIELARGAMITRARDLMAFEQADARDVRLVDDGDGLAFAFCGVIPERRFLLPALYGCLTLKNGVPMGYVQVEVIGPWAAVSFNTFDTFRGGEAGYVFGRLLSAIRHVFGAESFSIEPYQLGQDNEEGIESGAWWFYYKLGFRPRAAAARRLARREAALHRVNPLHRSSARTLRALAEHHLYFDLDPARPRGLPPVQDALSRAVRWLARHGGGAAAERRADEAARAVTGLRSLRGLDAGERLAWRRWAPLVASLPGVTRWSAAERRELAAIVRAKGHRQELEFLLRFAAHPKLARVLFGKAP